MRKLEKITIKNFKSIREQSLSLKALNIFIGGNGSGKSNLIQVFRFLREIVEKNLGEHVAKKGGADSILYFGRKTSNDMSFSLEFGEGNYSNSYTINLLPTDDDSIFIWDETAYYHDKLKYKTPYDLPLSSNSKESKLKEKNHICAEQVFQDLSSYRIYHFHDTSDTALAKGTCDVNDNLIFRPQAENLAAFLYWMQEKKPTHLKIIKEVISQAAPFFEGFRLSPSRLNDEKIRLEWKEKGSDAYFNASSLSDGTLRFICLTTLLLQPELPAIILLDEPELGLHPAAITLLANMLDSASTRTQVIVATQSVTLVNQFQPEHVWTVNREEGQSVFSNLETEEMSQWLENYSLGDMWEKNIIGARP